VRSVIGDLPPMPGRLLKAATAHAFRLRRAVMGDEFFLVGALQLDAQQPARRALESEGLNAKRLLGEIRASGDDSAAAPDWLTYSPACYLLLGRAQGFAAVLGEGPMTPEHVLLAVLWDPGSTSSHLLWRLGVDRGRVLERLRDLGVAVPSTALPPQREIEWGEQVWFDRDKVNSVLDHVRLHFPPDTRWGFNYENDRAWVRAEASVELRALVEGALAACCETPPQEVVPQSEAVVKKC
jgi:hypothetical protein